MLLDLQQLANLGQFISGLAVVVLLYQLWAMRRAEIGGNSIELLKYLQGSEIQAARRTVIVNLRGKPLKDFSSDDDVAAGRVCASYEMAGALIKRGMADEELFVHTWGPSIILTRYILDEYLSQKRREMGGGYWGHYDWLRDRAQRYHTRLGSKINLLEDKVVMEENLDSNVQKTAA